MSDMAINPRISDLATQLDLSEPDVMAVCDLLGIVYRSSHTRVSDAQAGNIRRRVERMRSLAPEGTANASAPTEQTSWPPPRAAAIEPESGVPRAASPVVPIALEV